jgi:hypothetical protein
MTADELLRHEEMLAALAALRGENARLHEQAARLRDLKTAPADLRRANARLKADNARLRERLKGERHALPDGVMTFGRHQGQPVTAVPTQYLAWCLDNCFEKAELRRKQSARLKAAIEDELIRRHEEACRIWEEPHNPQRRAPCRG